MEKPRKGLKIGRLPVYDQSFKIAVSREYLAGNYSLAQVGERHNLSRDTVHHFIRWYKENYPEPALVEVVKGAETKLERTREELEKELAYANLKITAFEILISNAEREMGVDIRKKAGSKPSRK